MSWKKLLSYFVPSIGIFVSPALAFAQAQPGATGIDINVSPPNVTGGLQIITNIGALISASVAIILIVAALAAFIYLVWGGIRWITSGGDKAGIDAARNQIQAALLGLFIVFAAWAIMLIIQTFFGVQILGNILIPTPFQFQK